MGRRSATPVRFEAAVGERLAAHVATHAGSSMSSTANRLVDEGLRMIDHPGVVFRDGPTGRRAGLVAGPDVWEVVRAVKSARAMEPDLDEEEILHLAHPRTPVRELPGVQPQSALTVRQAIEHWLEVARLEDTTRDRSDDLIRIYIGPTLGSMRAAKLDAQMLERWYARLQRCRSACDGRHRAGHVCQPLSSSTVRKIHFILNAALGRAARWSQITVNPAQLAQAPVPAATEPPYSTPRASSTSPAAAEPW
jgi:hypothetical protein